MRAGLAILVLAGVAAGVPLGCATGGAGSDREPVRPDLPAPDRPNLVLIIGADVGYGDFGFMESPVAKTPHLDRLAAEGTLFTRGYSTASVDRPALVSLLTGLDPLMYDTRVKLRSRRLEKLGKPEPPVGIALMPTLPRMLAKRGYVSFMAGKYLEGSWQLAGFDDGTVPILGAKRLVRVSVQPVYDFIDAHADEPFFLWFAPQLPQLPYDAPPEFSDLYADSGLSSVEVGYFANLSRLDAAVGELVAYLESRDLRKRTLLVYVSDNGWQIEGFDDVDDRRDGPKGKESLYELGVRTPIVFNAPGWIPGGVVRPDIVSTIDLAPTLLDYAGAAERSSLEGYDLRPVLEGDEPASGRGKVIGSMTDVRRPNPRAKLVGRKGERSGAYLRDDRWYYILYDQGSDALFDMKEDPSQERDVSSDYPEIVADFRNKITRWRAKMTVGTGPKVYYHGPAPKGYKP